MKKAKPDSPPEYDRARIIERPDGFYWQSEDRREEYGPFPTLPEAVAAMQSDGATSLEAGESLEPGESLEEAEDEIGIARWIDPDTGEPAEESVPRLEDH